MRAANAGVRGRRWRLAAALSLAPLLLFLFLTAGYSNGQAPEVRPRDGDGSSSSIENTVVIPSYHEAPNIAPLVTRIFAAVNSPAHTEVIIVDDNSRDGTVEAVEQLRGEGYNVVLVVRTDASGLSSAVLRGFKEARGNKFVVMDADLQHPPESVPLFFQALSERTPFAMGTRYGPGGGVDKDWPMYRRLMSAVARSLARPLTSASDPMSGFFGLTRELYAQSAPVNPVGFKIALELLLKTHISRSPSHSLAEIPYSFTKRTLGASKLSNKIIFRYLFHLAALYRWRLGFLGVVVMEVALVGACWVALWGLEKASAWWKRRRRAELRRREKFKLDV
ncbi:Dolichol-phosphate mannosyltransferase subunit 1 [Mycena venus]|uniref:Dolichol-phosphate mannosyltransferase subunit 1 n=1 Tax=Mycena venus TaxID=2733690 RepID=A0A8H6X668_9AGAR|nr:Dolichol-phosphate mannosyltransferase subunit 1 [Mycena venus]